MRSPVCAARCSAGSDGGGAATGRSGDELTVEVAVEATDLVETNPGALIAPYAESVVQFAESPTRYKLKKLSPSRIL